MAWLGSILDLAEPFGTLRYLIGRYGPFLAALVVTWFGSDSVWWWARQIVDRRVAPRWYPAALTVPLLVVALTSVGLAVLGTSIDPGLLPGRVSLVLGVVWALWHLPLLATGTTEFHGLPRSLNSHRRPESAS